MLCFRRCFALLARTARIRKTRRFPQMSQMSLTQLPDRAVSAQRLNKAYCELTLLAILVSVMTFFALRAFPEWDDGLTLLEIQHGGGRALLNWMLDRPVLARIQCFAADSGHLMGVAGVVYWLTWFGVGWVTMRLWKILFPSRPEFALPAACLAVAPLVYRLQTVLISGTWVTLVGPLLTWLVLLELLAPRASKPSLFRTIALHAVLVVVVAASTLVSEYELPTVVAGAVLLAGLGPRPAGNSKQTWMTIGLLLLTAAAAYAVYHRLGSSESRPGIRPELQDWAWRIPVVGPRLLTATWRLSLGILLERMGDFDFSGGKEMLLALLAGLVVAGGVQWMSRRRVNSQSIDEESTFHSPRVLLTLVLAAAAGILPVVVMGIEIRTWSGSRFFGPLLPVESCLSVALLTLVARRRLATMLPAVCGLLAGYYIVSDGWFASSERRATVQLGEQLKSFVPDNGTTVAFLTRNSRYSLNRGSSDAEITSRLTSSWPQEKREHFWAFLGGPSFHDPNAVIRDSRATILLRAFGADPRLSHPWREQPRPADKTNAATSEDKSHSSGLRAAGGGGDRVTQFLWLTEDPSGKLHVRADANPEGPIAMSAVFESSPFPYGLMALWIALPGIWLGAGALTAALPADRTVRRILQPAAALAGWIVAVQLASMTVRSFWIGLPLGMAVLSAAGLAYWLVSRRRPIADVANAEDDSHFSRAMWVSMILVTAPIAVMALRGHFHDELLNNGHISYVAELQNDNFPPRFLGFAHILLRYHYGFDLVCAGLTA